MTTLLRAAIAINVVLMFVASLRHDAAGFTVAAVSASACAIGLWARS